MQAALSGDDVWSEDRDVHLLRFEAAGEAKRTEVLFYEQHGNARVAEGVIAGVGDARPLGLTFRVQLDLRWTIRLFEARPLGLTEPVRLQSDGAGGWTDGHGVPLDELFGCVDLDFEGTSFSLTPMIRRLGLSAGGSVDLDVVSISADHLVPVRARRRLVCVQPLQLYRYEDPAAESAVEVKVDGDGFVIDVAGRFHRVG